MQALRGMLLEAVERDRAINWFEDESGLHLRYRSGEDLVTTLALSTDPTSLFAPVVRLEIHTLVAWSEDLTDEVHDFLREANQTAVGGSWEWFADGAVGLTASVLASPAHQDLWARVLPGLLHTHLEEARRGAAACPLAPPEDLAGTGATSLFEFRAGWEARPDVRELAELVFSRSGFEPLQQFLLEDVGEYTVDLLVPEHVGDQTSTGEAGDPPPDLKELHLVRAEHPHAGFGTVVQVRLAADVRHGALRWPVEAGILPRTRWWGASLGALVVDSRYGEDPEVVLRVFVPDATFSNVSPSEALDLLVMVALGSVNLAGASATVLRSLLDDERAPDGFDQDRLRNRPGILRSTVPLHRDEFGLIALDRGSVEVGRALLDWLALERLQIGTAPYALLDDGFVWLPSPCPQYLTVTDVHPSRGIEISDVRIRTRLGTLRSEDLIDGRTLAVDLAQSVPGAAVVVSEDGTVDLASTFVVHEGVWWHRAALVTVIAAAQVNFSRLVHETFDEAGLELAPWNEPLLEGMRRSDVDPIVDVLPHLRDRTPHDPGVIASLVISELSTDEGAEVRDTPDGPYVVTPLRGNEHDGGWEPALGNAAVFVEPDALDPAGPVVLVTAHPGFPLSEGLDLWETANHLTALHQAQGGLAFGPSWRVVGDTVAAGFVFPLAAAHDAPPRTLAELIAQVARSCLHALARAVTEDPRLLPGFDHALLYRPELCALSGSVNLPEGFVIWPSGPHGAVLTGPVSGGRPSMCRAMYIGDRWETADHLEERDPRWWSPPGSFDLAIVHEGEHTVLRADGAGRHVWHVGDDRLADLAALLRCPEAAAVGVPAGPVVVDPAEVWGDRAEGEWEFHLPPAPVVLRTWGEGLESGGIPVTTQRSVLWQFRSPRGSFHVDLPLGLVEAMCQATHESVRVRLRLPWTDHRVTGHRPVAPVDLELATRDLHDALAHAGQEPDQS